MDPFGPPRAAWRSLIIARSLTIGACAGRVVKLDAGPLRSSCCPANLQGVTDRSRPRGEAWPRGVGDLDLDDGTTRRVVDSTTARCSTVGCAVLGAVSPDRCDFTAALWGEG